MKWQGDPYFFQKGTTYPFGDSFSVFCDCLTGLGGSSRQTTSLSVSLAHAAGAGSAPVGLFGAITLWTLQLFLLKWRKAVMGVGCYRAFSYNQSKPNIIRVQWHYTHVSLYMKKETYPLLLNSFFKRTYLTDHLHKNSRITFDAKNEHSVIYKELNYH